MTPLSRDKLVKIISTTKRCPDRSHPKNYKAVDGIIICDACTDIVIFKVIEALSKSICKRCSNGEPAFVDPDVPGNHYVHSDPSGGSSVGCPAEAMHRIISECRCME